LLLHFAAQYKFLVIIIINIIIIAYMSLTDITIPASIFLPIPGKCNWTFQTMVTAEPAEVRLPDAV